MKKLAVVLFIVLCAAFAQAKEKPNPADYAIKMHISAAHFQLNPLAIGGDTLYVDATLDGKKFQLAGRAPYIQNNSVLILPGDYPAKLIKDVHNADGTRIHREYELLQSDGTTWDCMTTGVSE
jgi:hypothetical protein